MDEIYFKNAAEWRTWLAGNHNKFPGIWLVFYKKETGKPTLVYEHAIEEALCYGWVDSIIRKIDEEKYVRKFTPRKDNSKWSESNKKRVERLIKQNCMAEPGLSKVAIAKENGMWDKPDRPQISLELSKEFKSALDKNHRAKQNFEDLASSYQKHYIAWIVVARKPETQTKRIKESIRLLESGEKLGLK